MFYEFALTVPANTPQAAPAELEMPLSPGTVTLVSVQFPRGCVGLVHVQVLDAEHQVWPTNLDGDISGENATISWPEDHDLVDSPYTFTLRAWNLDDTFPHTVTFRCAVMPLSQKEEARAGVGILQRLRDTLIGAP